MIKDEKTGEDTSGGAKFAEAMGEAQKLGISPERGHSDAMLAAHRLAHPFARLRANQLRMEAVRAEAEDSERAAAFAARADAADAQAASIEDGIARLRIVQPETCANSVTVYGYVRDGDEPVAGAAVALFDGEDTRATIDSDKDGSFKLSACSEVPLGVQVSVKGKLAHRDPAEVHPPSAVAAYRVIDLRQGETPAPVQDPPKGECTPSQPKPPEEEEAAAQSPSLAAPEHFAAPAAAPASTKASPQFAELIRLMTASDVAKDLEWSDEKVTQRWLALRGIRDIASAKKGAAMSADDIAKQFKIDFAAAKRLKRALTAAIKKLGTA